MRLPFSLRLKVSHAHPEVYSRAMEWVDLQDPDLVAKESAWGITYLNGVIYVSAIGFKHEEDRTMFALMFPEFL